MKSILVFLMLLGVTCVFGDEGGACCVSTGTNDLYYDTMLVCMAKRNEQACNARGGRSEDNQNENAANRNVAPDCEWQETCSVRYSDFNVADDRPCRSNKARNQNGLCEDHEAIKLHMETMQAYFAASCKDDAVSANLFAHTVSGERHHEDFVFNYRNGENGGLDVLATLAQIFTDVLETFDAEYDVQMTYIDADAYDKYIITKTGYVTVTPTAGSVLSFFADENGKLTAEFPSEACYILDDGIWKVTSFTPVFPESDFTSDDPEMQSRGDDVFGYFDEHMNNGLKLLKRSLIDGTVEIKRAAPGVNFSHVIAIILGVFMFIGFATLGFLYYEARKRCSSTREEKV